MKSLLASVLIFLATTSFAKITYHAQVGASLSSQADKIESGPFISPGQTASINESRKRPNKLYPYLSLGLNKDFNETYSINFDVSYLKSFGLDLISYQADVVYSINDKFSVFAGVNLTDAKSFEEHLYSGHVYRKDYGGGYQVGVYYKLDDNFSILYSIKNTNITVYSSTDKPNGSSISYETYKINNLSHLVGIQYNF